ncbi:unnamed protein product [Phaedon cochleariae]|uniref:Alpha-methylacyl-CoA racemase n=1 Tax=Phaedon cochleariae TaxID=80249 RepID=A0A9N9SIZ4_PHACE|nr:unnamed protein product [Phaedon cochleariae]
MPLKNLKVLELSGLLPVPYCGMVLADFGASVIRVDRIGVDTTLDVLGNGKKSISLNLKHCKAIDILKSLSRNADVLIEPFRKGVMEKLGLGPDVLLKENPKLIYARLNGYGQTGKFSKSAGHDINYVAISGLLSLFGRHGQNPSPPVNVLADIAGGGMLCCLGILLALIERNKSCKGQVVENSMVEGTAYLGSWLYRGKKSMLWGDERGKNILDSGTHFYEVYETKDGKYLSVGALEPQFYQELLEGKLSESSCSKNESIYLVIGLQLSEEEAPQIGGDFDKLKKLFRKKFLEKTQDQWCEIFDSKEACVTPILTLDEAPQHPHNVAQQTFVQIEDIYAPNPHPRLSQTPGISKATEPIPIRGEHTKEILIGLGYSSHDIDKLEHEGVVECHKKSKL